MPQDKNPVRFASDMFDVIDILEDIESYDFLVQDSIYESEERDTPNTKKIMLALSLYQEKVKELIEEAKDILNGYAKA